MSIEVIADDQAVSWIQKSFPYIGGALTALGTLIFNYNKNALKATNDELIAVEKALHNHNDRLIVIESNYVKSEDLEEILDGLRRDLENSFTRAHTRIDQLYQNPRKD